MSTERPVERGEARFECNERIYYLRPESGGGWSFPCPICERRRALRPPEFMVTMTNQNLVTVHAVVKCPTRDCGWRAMIRNGHAEEI